MSDAIVSAHQVASFANPQNGQTNNADVVRGNDNAIVAAYNAHDADPTIHYQSSPVADLAAPGTPNRLWLTTDAANGRMLRDTGSAWVDMCVGQVRQASGTTGGILDGVPTLIFQLANTISLGTWLVHAVIYNSTPKGKYLTATIAGPYSDNNFYVVNQTGDGITLTVSNTDFAGFGTFYLAHSLTGQTLFVPWTRAQIHGSQP